MEFSGIKISIIKAAVIGVVTYFFMYILVSAALFWFDGFSTARVFLISLGLFIVVVRIITNETRKRISLDNLKPSLKETLFFVGIVAAAIILSGSKFGFFGMGQDQGVYQTKAIELIYDNNSNELDFDYAVETLEDPKDLKYFSDIVKCLQGYYLVGQTDAYHADDNAGGESGLRGVYHGLPTWPAIMSLFGKALGMSHMQDCQTIFFICYLMIAFYILENFRIRTICEAAFIAILATTPQTIWVSKSALTEMFLAVIFATFLYLACHENKDIRLFMWIPVAVFSFYHVSAYTMMPIFMIISWINLLSDKRKRAVATPLLILATYFAGFAFSIKLSTLYTSVNYIMPLQRFTQLFGIEEMSNESLMAIVTCAVLVCAVITLILAVINKMKVFNDVIGRIVEKQGIILKGLFILLIAFSVFIYFKQNSGFAYNPNFNIIALSLACGLITIILAFFGIVIIKPHLIKGIQFTSITLIFAYIVVWAVLLRNYISFFYYYSRYNVTYLIVPAIFICVIFRDIKSIDWLPVICGASVIMYLDYDAVMIKTPDDTNVEWRVVEEVLENEWLTQSAVILNNNHRTKIEWMLPLKASGLDVFIFDGDLDSQTDKLLEKYNSVYFVDEGIEEINIAEYSAKNFVKEYSCKFIHSEDIVNGTESWTGYPREFYSEEMSISIYLLK